MKCSSFTEAREGFPSVHCTAEAEYRVKGKDPEGNEYDEPACHRHARYFLIYHPDMYQIIEDIDGKWRKTYYNIGDRIELKMPASGVCMHMRIVGQRMQVEIKEHGAQLYKPDGTIFSSPITWGEAGIYTDRSIGNRPYVSSH